MSNINIVQHIDYRELLSSIDSDSSDLIFTDPPFGISYQNNKTAKKYDVLVGDDESFSYADLASQSYRVLKSGGCAFVFTGWSTYPQHREDFIRAGFDVKEPLIVQKRASGKTDLYGSLQSNSNWLIFATKGRFLFRETEILRNKQHYRNHVKEFKSRFPSCWFGDEYPFSNEHPEYLKKYNIRHPTVKGLEFCSWIIQISTDLDGTVIDPFCGSGTIPLACKLLNRNCYSGDIEGTFVELTRERLVGKEEITKKDFSSVVSRGKFNLGLDMTDI